MFPVGSPAPLSVAPRRSDLPPFDRVTLGLGELQRPGRTPDVAAGTGAETPQLLRRPVVAVDEIVEVKAVDLASVQLCKPSPQPIDQGSELSLVVLGHPRTRGLPFGLLS